LPEVLKLLNVSSYMNKTIQNLTVILPFLLVFSLESLQAQSDKTTAFEKAMVTEFCDSFTKASPRITKQNWTAEMGMAMLPILTKYRDQIESEWGLSVGSSENLRAIGEKLGQMAAFQCDAFKDFVKANLKDIVNQQDGAVTKTFLGKITGIEGKPFTYLQVQNNQGRTDKFYWLEFFPGADKLTSGKNYLNKPITLTYKEMEIYQALEKEYRTIKVIVGVEL
jgi:hypothetical protein